MPMQDSFHDTQVLGHTKAMNKPLCRRVPVQMITIRCNRCPVCL